jgi:hypothetical protein
MASEQQTNVALVILRECLGLEADGTLGDSAKRKLTALKKTGDSYATAGYSYRYVFADSRKTGGVRACDVMKKAMQEMDNKYLGIDVPEDGRVLDTFDSRQLFTMEVRREANNTRAYKYC